ncbi:cation transporter [Acetobacterium bakii]|nr:cation transporter [Acetobacterium bakii]
MSEKNDYRALFRITLMNFLITGVLALGFMTYLYFSTGSLLFLIQVVANFGSTVTFGMYALVLKKQADNKSYAYEYGLGKFEAISTFAGFIIQDVNLIILAVLAVNDFIHVDMDISFGFLAFAYSSAVVLYDAAVIIILKKKSRSDNGIVKSQIVDCFNEGLQLAVTLGAMALVTLFPDSMGIYRFQYIICLVIIGYCFYVSLEPIKTSVNSLLDKCTDEKVAQKILKVLAVNFELYELFETYHTRVSASTTFIDLFIGYDDALTAREILQRNATIEGDIRKLIPDAVINCILIGDSADTVKQGD